jgi:hypothetical protein
MYARRSTIARSRQYFSLQSTPRHLLCAHSQTTWSGIAVPLGKYWTEKPQFTT